VHLKHLRLALALALALALVLALALCKYRARGIFIRLVGVLLLVLLKSLWIGDIALCRAVGRCGYRCYRVSLLVDMVISRACIVKVRRLRVCRGIGVVGGIVVGIEVVVIVVDIIVKDGRGRGA